MGDIADDAASLPFLDAVMYLSPNGVASPWLIQRGDAPVEHCHPASRVDIGNAESVAEAVAQGFGVGQLATWLIQERLDTGELIEVLPSLAVAGPPLHLQWQRSRQLLPKVDALLKHLGNRLHI